MKKLYVKQTEVNSGGGIRLSVYKQIIDPDTGELLHEEPHLVAIGPLDDFDAVMALNMYDLARTGYPAIDPAELALPLALRKTAHAHPAVKASIAAEREAVKAARRAAEAEAAAEEAPAAVAPPAAKPKRRRP